jgi:hypothetical protein
MAIQICDALQEVLRNGCSGLEVGVIECGFFQDQEPGLDQVEPRSVSGCPGEMDVGWLGVP